MTQIHNPDTDILTSRTFPVSRDVLFQHWINPELLSQRRGPAGFTNTFATYEPVPGGRRVFTMHGPDGTIYPNESRFVEIIYDERIVFDHVVEPMFRVVATFANTERAGETDLVRRMTFPSKEICDAIKTYAIPANEENMDRLQSLLAHGHV